MSGVNSVGDFTLAPTPTAHVQLAETNDVSPRIETRPHVPILRVISARRDRVGDEPLCVLNSVRPQGWYRQEAAVEAHSWIDSQSATACGDTTNACRLRASVSRRGSLSGTSATLFEGICSASPGEDVPDEHASSVGLADAWESVWLPAEAALVADLCQ